MVGAVSAHRCQGTFAAARLTQAHLRPEVEHAEIGRPRIGSSSCDRIGIALKDSCPRVRRAKAEYAPQNAGNVRIDNTNAFAITEACDRPRTVGSYAGHIFE